MYEYACIEIALSGVTELFVFGHNHLEELIDFVEIVIRSSFISINLVLHFSFGCRHRYTALNEKEVRSTIRSMSALVGLQMLKSDSRDSH